MKLIISTIFMMSLFLIGQAQCVFHHVHNMNDDNDIFQGLLEDSYGDIVTTGMTDMASYICKTDACGDTIWIKVYDFSLTGADRALNVIQNSDTSYVICGYTHNGVEGSTDGIIYSLSLGGDTLWLNQINVGINDRFADLRETTDGGFIVGGYRNVTGDSTMFLLKTNSTGQEEWREFYGGSGNDGVEDVAITADGGFVLFGDLLNSGSSTYDYQVVKTNSSGVEEWSYQYDTQDAVNNGGGYGITTIDGGFLLVGGKETSSGSGSEESFLVKLDEFGIEEWKKEWDLPIPSSSLWDVVQNPDGSYVACGLAIYGTDYPVAWLVKFNSVGDTIWAKSYSYYDPAIAHQYPGELIRNADGGYTVVGYIIHTTLSVGNDGFMLRLDSLGNTCTVTDSSLGCSNLNCDYITADFTISDTVFVVNDTATVQTFYNGLGDVLFWQFGGTDIWTSATSYTYQYTTQGTFPVGLVVQDPTGFCIDTVFQNVTILANDVDKLSATEEFKLYPNPNNGAFTLEFSHGMDTDAKFYLYDIMGRSIKIYTVSNQYNVITINDASLNGGLYFYELVIDGEVKASDKMIIQK